MKHLTIALISFIGLLAWITQPLAKTIKPAQDHISTSFQTGPTVIPIEHATAVIKWGETTLYIDPVGGAEAFENQPSPDLVLITDVHGDHLNSETLESILTDKTTLITPKAVADLLPEALMGKANVLNNGESKSFMGIEVTAIPMYNLREEARDFHVKGRGNGYVLEKEGTRIYFSGDTEDIPEMRALKNIDMAFVCMNLPYTMTVAKAADAVLEFAPKKVYPYHYRGKPDVSDVVEFKRLVNASNPEIEVVQLDWYPKAPF
jgi:L-ascorbate metabolism protein UlaG (beta-lactamase superfamily)